MVKFYSTPFARDGARNEISEAADPNGKVSFAEGYTEDYQRDLTTDPKAKDIDRGSLNGLFFNVTQALGSLQRSGNEEWNQVMAPYPARAMVRRGGFIWISNIDNNYVEPRDGIGEWTRLLYAPGNANDYNNADWGKLVTTGLLHDLLKPNPNDQQNQFQDNGAWTDKFSGFGIRWGYLSDINTERYVRCTFAAPFQHKAFMPFVTVTTTVGNSTWNLAVRDIDRFGMTVGHGKNERNFWWCALGF